jgi:hypothetical protein
MALCEQCKAKPCGKVAAIRWAKAEMTEEWDRQGRTSELDTLPMAYAILAPIRAYLDAECPCSCHRESERQSPGSGGSDIAR